MIFKPSFSYVQLGIMVFKSIPLKCFAVLANKNFLCLKIRFRYE